MRRALLAAPLLGLALGGVGCLVGDGFVDVADGGLGSAAAGGSGAAAGTAGSAGATGGAGGGAPDGGGSGGAAAGSGGGTACTPADLSRCTGSEFWGPCCLPDLTCGYRNDQGACQDTPRCDDAVSCRNGECCAGPEGGCSSAACGPPDGGGCDVTLCPGSEFHAPCCQPNGDCGLVMGESCAPDAVCSGARCGAPFPCCTAGALSVCGTPEGASTCRAAPLPCGPATCRAAWVSPMPPMIAELAPPCCGPGQQCGLAIDGSCEPSPCPASCDYLGPSACCRAWDGSCGVLDAAGVCGAATTCVPKTCAELGKNCDWVADGCGAVVNCGSCTVLGETCGGGGIANVCGSPPCVRRTCADLAAGECGTLSDGCTGTITCSTCAAPETCGGGGTPNRCGAPPCSPAMCDDGAYCNGAEQCVGSSCVPGTPPSCNDGVACTTDACDEAADACTHTPVPALCNDGLQCNGSEDCTAGGCVSAPAGSGPCKNGGVCTEPGGQVTCACPAGWTGPDCTSDVNECLSANGGCSVNATCTNTPGARSCVCNTGYTGNGITCAPI